MVFVDRPPVGLPVDAVLTDNHDGAAAAVHHLVRHGHRDIAYLGDLQTIPTARQRFQGFKEALSDHGIRPEAATIVHDLHTERDSEEAARRLLTRESPPTALFTSQKCDHDRADHRDQQQQRRDLERQDVRREKASPYHFARGDIHRVLLSSAAIGSSVSRRRL